MKNIEFIEKYRDEYRNDKNKYNFAYREIFPNVSSCIINLFDSLGDDYLDENQVNRLAPYHSSLCILSLLGDLKKYGLKYRITDKEKAIEYLSVNPNFWEYLSDDLKLDNDVINHYQPMVAPILLKLVRNEDDEEEEINNPSSPKLTAQKNFEIYKHNGAIVQIPTIKFPENFEFEKYFAIQNELMETLMSIDYSTNLDTAVVSYSFGDLLFEYFDESSHWTRFLEDGDGDVKVVDRSKLHEIVMKHTNNKRI